MPGGSPQREEEEGERMETEDLEQHQDERQRGATFDTAAVEVTAV